MTRKKRVIITLSDNRFNALDGICCAFNCSRSQALSVAIGLLLHHLNDFSSYDPGRKLVEKDCES